MERRPDADEAGRGADRKETLRSLLPSRPQRLLALGWDPDQVPGDLAAAIVHRSTLDTETREERFDALLWRTDADQCRRQALAQGRELLTEDGRLVLVLGAERAESVAAMVRPVVRDLSELGYVVVAERDPGPLAAAGSVLVARRDPFLVRSYRDGDEAAILRLFAASFHAERSLEHWRWKYRDNPWGGLKISLACTRDGELAVHYAGYPMPFWCEGRASLALHMGDTMTDPAYRRVGRGATSLLARTVRHFFAIHREGPFGFFFGFNTGGIQRFCRWFIGGSRVELVGYRTRDLDPAPPWGPAAGYRVRRVERVGGAWDRFFRRVAPHYRFLVQRDARYVDWRYLRSADDPFVILAAWHWGRLVGWSVFRRREDRLVWGDALFHPRHVGAAEAILGAAVAAPELAGASVAEAWFPDRPDWWHRQLTRLGFETRPEPNRLAFMFLPDREQDSPERLRYLYYTMGDGDLF